MAMKKMAIQEEVSPNLIPMIDIMFLLLLFLMIASDMGQRELELVELPKAISVKKDELDTKSAEGDRVTINVYHRLEVKCEAYKKGDICREEGHWLMGIKGSDYSNMEKLENYLRKQADPLRGKDQKFKDASDKKVMIRADGAAPFGMPQKAMYACAKVGIFKIELGAARPAEEGKRK